MMVRKLTLGAGSAVCLNERLHQNWLNMICHFLEPVTERFVVLYWSCLCYDSHIWLCHRQTCAFVDDFMFKNKLMQFKFESEGALKF